jgi:hypothetical protein
MEVMVLMGTRSNGSKDRWKDVSQLSLSGSVKKGPCVQKPLFTFPREGLPQEGELLSAAFCLYMV